MPESDHEIPSIPVIYARLTVVIEKLDNLEAGQVAIQKSADTVAEAAQKVSQEFNARLGATERDVVRLQERQGVLMLIQAGISTLVTFAGIIIARAAHLFG